MRAIKTLKGDQKKEGSIGVTSTNRQFQAKRTISSKMPYIKVVDAVNTM